MANTAYTELYPYCEYELPGISFARPLLLQTVRGTIKEFCEQTLVWLDDATAIDVVADTKQYTLVSPDAQGEIVAFKKVERRYSDGGDLSELDPEIDYTRTSQTQIKLVANPPENVTSGLEVQVCLRPIITATEIPEDYFNAWYDVWANGVKSKLMLSGKQSWSDHARGAECKRDYWDGISRCRANENKGGLLVDAFARPEYIFA